MKTKRIRQDGKPRIGNKITHTQARIHLRELTWEPLRAVLLKHIQSSPKGEASRIARYLGTSPAQIHRWTCPICEHDNEPNFSQGYALLILLQSKQFLAPPVRTYTDPNHPAFTVIKPTARNRK